jgi:hypothetical protein
LMDGMVVGIKFSTKELENFQCDVCVLGKAHKAPIYNPRPRVEKVGQMFHTDVCGPMSVLSINGNRWLCIVMDNVSRLSFLFFMKDKDDAATHMSKWSTHNNQVESRCSRCTLMVVVSSSTRIWINFSRVKVSSR